MLCHNIADKESVLDRFAYNLILEQRKYKKNNLHRKKHRYHFLIANSNH